MTSYEKKGHLAKIPDMPFLLLFASAELCTHSHIFVLFMQQNAETQWPLMFRHPGNSEFEKKYSVYAVCLRSHKYFFREEQKSNLYVYL